MRLQLIIAWAVLGACILTGCDSAENHKKDAAFEFLFGESPGSNQVAQLSMKPSVLTAGGICALVFTSSEDEIARLMVQAGYVPTAIDSDPGTWRLSLTESSLKELLGKDISIKDSFHCFTKYTETNRSRVFFDSTNRAAIFLGYGAFPEIYKGQKSRGESRAF